MSQPKEATKISPCKCGSKEFRIGYSEYAYQDITADGKLGDDGYDMSGHDLDTDSLWCKKCLKKKNLTKAEVNFILEESE